MVFIIVIVTFITDKQKLEIQLQPTFHSSICKKNHPTGLHSSRILCTLGQDLCMFFSSKTLSKILLYFPLPHGKECFCTSLAFAPQHGGDLAAFLLGSTVCKNTPVSRGASGSRLWCANLTAKPRARRPRVKCVLTLYHRTLH